MKKQLIFLLPLLVLLLSACSNNELSGETYDVSVRSSINNSDKLDAKMTLEFSDGNIVKNTRGYEEGTYELNEDELVLLFENDNETLEIIFTLNESEQEFSMYSAELSDAVYDMNDKDKISHLRNLYFNLEEKMTYELIKK